MKIIFKEATIDDCDLLFRWVNDPLVRKSAFNSELIYYEDHKNWLLNKLNSSNTNIFIIYNENSPIGQIRLDYKDGIGFIDYSVDNSFRGKGYGTFLVKEIVNIILQKKLPIKKLIGQVKYSNVASQKAFIKAGYIQRNFKDFIEYSKDLFEE